MAEIDRYVATLRDALPAPDERIVTALTPTGTLRAGINLSNFLLVTGRTQDGAPEGVSPSMAQVLANLLGLELELVVFDSPGAVADAAERDAWDIGNIGADPARAAFITFSDAYCEIESTCLVPQGSTIQSFEELDQPGKKIATKARAAYTLWLERHLKNAELRQYDSADASFDGFVAEGLDALAGLRPRLTADSEKLPGSRVLSGKFAAVQQAIGVPSNRDPAGAAYVQRFVKKAKHVGLVAALIDQHGVKGKLSVADK